MDPHRNIFFYYAGSSKASGGRNRQIEDNTTKALINLLEIATVADDDSRLLRDFLKFIGASGARPAGIRFALQKSTIGQAALKRAKKKVLLGIAPSAKAPASPPASSKKVSSRPDAWIWGRDFVVCVETKVVGTFDTDQLKRHQKTLGSGVRRVLLEWRDIYGFFVDQLAVASERHQNQESVLLLEQFLAYLRIIAYRQEIDMGEFDGFRPEHLEAFTFLDDEYSEDTRRQVKHHLSQYVDAVSKALPAGLRGFKYKNVGNLRSGARHVWATLSREKNPVHEPHFSFSVGSDEVGIRLLLEGKRPTQRALRNIEARPDEFLKLLRALPDWKIVLNRRWNIGVRRFAARRACMIELSWIQKADVEYLIRKMKDLGRKEKGKGLFMLVITRGYAVDAPELASKAFAKTAATALGELHPVEQFLGEA